MKGKHVSYIPGICNFEFLRAGRIYTHAFFFIYFYLQAHVQSKKEGKDQESIQSSTTPDPGYQWERDNVKIRAQRSALCQQVTARHQQTDVHESITKQDRNNILLDVDQDT